MREPIKWAELSQRERDALVIKTLGFELHSVDNFGHWVYFKNDQDATLFRPTQNIADAWLVLGLGLQSTPKVTYHASDGIWSCETDESRAEALTAPEAICIAALRAVGLQVVTE